MLQPVNGGLDLKDARVDPPLPEPVRRAELDIPRGDLRDARQRLAKRPPSGTVLKAQREVGDPVGDGAATARRDGFETARALTRSADEVPTAALQREALGERRETGDDVHDERVDGLQVERLQGVLPVLRVVGALHELPCLGERLQGPQPPSPPGRRFAWSIPSGSNESSHVAQADLPLEEPAPFIDARQGFAQVPAIGRRHLGGAVVAASTGILAAVGLTHCTLVRSAACCFVQRRGIAHPRRFELRDLPFWQPVERFQCGWLWEVAFYLPPEQDYVLLVHSGRAR